MAENKVYDATWNLLHSVRETNQAIADSWVTVQERNMKLAQSFFTNWMEILKAQADTNRALAEKIVQQSERQREAWQTLAHESVDTYVDLMSSSIDYTRQAVDAADHATRQGL